MIAIIDYGMGNLRSVYNAFRTLGRAVTIASKPEQLRDAWGIVLPGVGAFGDGMHHLREWGFAEELDRQVLRGGKPFLGLCLGMQLLATTGFEHGENPGLNWIQGTVERIKFPNGNEKLRIPHIGWNEVRFEKKEGLYVGLGERQSFYFVHSFVLKPNDPCIVSGMCDYGSDLVASVEFENIVATQFHPEKSHKAGLTVLRNWSDKLC
jgi:imidazole glycerol-phosphate synthase subunit HisH